VVMCVMKYILYLLDNKAKFFSQFITWKMEDYLVIIHRFKQVL
jgi:hypothetical protein